MQLQYVPIASSSRAHVWGRTMRFRGRRTLEIAVTIDSDNPEDAVSGEITGRGDIAPLLWCRQQLADIMQWAARAGYSYILYEPYDYRRARCFARLGWEEDRGMFFYPLKKGEHDEEAKL